MTKHIDLIFSHSTEKLSISNNV